MKQIIASAFASIYRIMDSSCYFTPPALKSTDREKVGGTESRDLLTYMIEERELQKEDLTIADIRGHVSYSPIIVYLIHE